MSLEDWTTAIPAYGAWWVSLPPTSRKYWDPVEPVEVDEYGTVWTEQGSICDVSDPFFLGAKWKPRVTPADPFTGSRP